MGNQRPIKKILCRGCDIVLGLLKMYKSRFRKQTSGYQRGEGREEGQIRGMGLTGTNYYTSNR